MTRWFRMTVITLMNRLKRRGWFTGDSWDAWRVVIKAMFALPMEESEQALFRTIAGGRRPPAKQVREAWFVVGRRGGKSLITALLAFFFATCGIYRLVQGEKGVIMIVAADRRQARVIFRYLIALFALVPFADLVERQTQEAIYLKNGLIIEIHTASFKSIRGYTVVCFIGDEEAFWSSDGANPDEEIFNASRPAMATIPQAMMIVLSSPYAKRGQLWETFKRYFGKDDDEILVIQAPSRTMNPSLPLSVVAKAYEDDPASASAEYGAEFRSDIESFIRPEAVAACVVAGRFELPPVKAYSYVVGFDASGGSGSDDMTLAVAHYEQRGERVIAVLDLVVGVKPPFSPESAMAELCMTVKPYPHRDVATGDRYAGAWPGEQFQKAGIRYELTDKPKSDLYRELLPAINSGLVELLDHPRLIAQLCALERRTARGGKDSIDHPPNGHDDYINAAAIALNLARREATRPAFGISSLDLAAENPSVETGTIGNQECDAAIVEGLRTGELFGFRR